MSDSLSDNKRIAKNTLLLYIRMIYSLAISLYTSRVILAALGFEDYGLYNAIGSVVSMFVFLRTSMGNSVQRFITFAIGQGDEKLLKKTFSLSLLIHFGIAVLIIILCETIGLWFLNSRMTIPIGREMAANWVFQFSVITCALSAICTPYDAAIIAHERMGIFAMIQILNSTLNFAIAYAVKFSNSDRLILYAFMLMMIQVMNRIIYGFYCRRNFKETKFQMVRDKHLFHEMFGFAGWSLLSNLAFIGCTQGINVLLNIFFGPCVNAARGIAYQLQGAIKGFVINFQVAVEPQITKTFAQNDFQRLHSLIFASSKFSFFLLLCIALPVAIEAKNILELWLGSIPDYTVIFTILTLAILLFEPLANPLRIANNATGKIRSYQIAEGGGLLLILPIGYIVTKITKAPTSVFYVQLIVMLVVQILRIFLVCHKVKMSNKDYLTKVILRVILVLSSSSIIPLLLYYFMEDNYVSMIIIILAAVTSVIVCSYLLGINKQERENVKVHLHKILVKLNI